MDALACDVVSTPDHAPGSADADSRTYGPEPPDHVIFAVVPMI
jgi:hypothetical protein